MIISTAAATHIVKPHKPKLKPKLAKECVCPNPERISKFFSHSLKKKLKHANPPAVGQAHGRHRQKRK